MEGPLEKLGTDSPDIRYCHRFEDETPVEQRDETLDGVEVSPSDDQWERIDDATEARTGTIRPTEQRDTAFAVFVANSQHR